MKNFIVFVLCLLGIHSSDAAVRAVYTQGPGGKIVANEPEFVKMITDSVNALDKHGLATVNANFLISSAWAPSGDYGILMVVPRSLKFEDQFANLIQKSVMDLMVVFAHEYAHLIFGNILAKELPIFAELRKTEDEISMLYLSRVGATPEVAAQIKIKMDEKRNFINVNPNFLTLKKIISPYNELFADAVAVFDANSKSAIHEALYYDEAASFYKEMIRARDFSLARDPLTWVGKEEHDLFAPLNSAIGSKKCWPKNARQRTLRLKQLVSVLVEDIKVKYATRTLPVSADNKNLVEKFTQFCK